MATEKNRSQTDVSVSVMPRSTRWWKLLPAATVTLLIIATLAVVLIVRKTTSPSMLATTRLLFADSSASKLIIADSANKPQYQLSYPLYSSPNFAAVAPNGQLLVVLSPGSNQEGFILAQGNKAISLSASLINTLRTSTVVGGSNQIFFSNSSTAIFVACADTCKLMSLDIASGRTKAIVDTGAKTAFPVPAYLLGLSTNNQSAFMRVIGDNKLGKDISAIYQIDLGSGTVLRQINVPIEAGYDVSLSPSRSSYIYWTGGSTTEVVLHVIDVTTAKGTVVKWQKDLLDGELSAFSWSPDGKKVLFASTHITLPTITAQSNPRNTTIAYLDLTKKTVVNLQTIKDQSRTMVTYLGWLDNDDIVYNQQNSSHSYDFSSPTNQAYKQNISSKQAIKLGDSSRQLLQVFRY